jgi:S-DNA-T family DNA segregation ATPase FtsK/SpoIIIE
VVTRKTSSSSSTKQKSKTSFPLDHYSYSTMVRFSSNPILFKINYINRDQFETTMNISGVIGRAFHTAMETYYGGGDESPTSEEEAIELGLRAGVDYLDKYEDGFINYNTTCPTKQKALELFTFAFNSYVKERPYNTEEIVGLEMKMEKEIDVQWRGQNVSLPVKLKGYLDKLIREDGKLKVIDYKTTRSFSSEDRIDGAKMIQAVQYYLLTYAETGEEPYSMVYEEVKTTKNRDNSPQVRRYEVVYAENELFFDFYFRLFEDMTRSLNGEAVYVPNVNALYDNEVAIIAYIHRLDQTEETAKKLKTAKVDTVSDLLKKEIRNASSMKSFMELAEKKFVSAKTLNYSKMDNQEKIKMKLMEFGMVLDFDEKVEGLAVDLYKYTPSIGLKMAKLKAYAADVEQVLGTSGIRVLAPIQDSHQVGFEVPRKDRVFPTIKGEAHGINVTIGVDIFGKPFQYDIGAAPHILVAGTTGSGKSFFLNNLIEQLTRNAGEVELHLFDPKMVEFMQWESATNVVEYQTDREYIQASLSMLVDEMNARYMAMKENGVKSIEGLFKPKVVFIDEFGDINNNEVQEDIRLLAQKSRMAGIHLVIATQRVSAKIINGEIKANFPVKVAFLTAKELDSRIILDEGGAEKLLGKGDMLFFAEGKITRLQGLG